MVVGTTCLGPLHLSQNRGLPLPWPQVPRSSLGTLPLRGRENCCEVWPGENARSSRWQGGLQFPGSGAQGYWEPALISLGWGSLPEGGFGGDLSCACPTQHLGPKPASWVSDENHFLGTSPRVFHPQGGGPPSGWKNRGIFAVGRTGRRSLRVFRNLGQ